MARYHAFLGRSVEVQYRAGDILLPASGTFVADSGRSIFLEQHIEQRGQQKQFRWEIPYQCIVRIKEKEDGASPAGQADAVRPLPSRVNDTQPAAVERQNQASVAAASGAAPSMVAVPNPPKTT
ncbi:MAG: hypothetical protein ACRD36_01255 [Candidatus Acidiferrum sp.]